jgi:predicted AAA+ superfamily ATPase
MERIEKPALLRQLFQLGCAYSGQIVSYVKMLGQLLDAGNTTTLAHYLRLTADAGLLTGLSVYSGSVVRKRASSPKLLALDTGLVTAHCGIESINIRNSPELWGRLVETAIGIHLVKSFLGQTAEIHYWRNGNLEVDFIVTTQKGIIALEVKSGRRRDTHSGSQKFMNRWSNAKPFLIGNDGISIKEFLSLNPVTLIT